MPSALAVQAQEFTAYLDRTRLDVRLLRRHHGRVLGAVAFALVILVQNGWFADHALAPPRLLLIGLSMIDVNLFTIGLLWSQRRGFSALAQPTDDVAARAGQIARYLDDRGILFLVLAVLGLGVLLAASVAGVNLFEREGAIFLVNLMPLGQLIVHARYEVPTRETLVRLYRMLAVHQHRKQILAARATAIPRPH